MTEYSEQLAKDIEENFKQIVLVEGRYGVLDNVNLSHHEFSSGLHGLKLDFDKVPTYSDLYMNWTSLMYRAIVETYADEEERPDALVGVANGANRLARHIAPKFGLKATSLETEKDKELSTIKLNLDGLRKVRRFNRPRFALVIDDVGTTGGSASKVAEQLLDEGVERVEAFFGWIRNPELTSLNFIDVVYNGLVRYDLPSLSPEVCEDYGYCSDGVPLIEYGSGISSSLTS
jgi:adenine/guanine phosphoribosyltransferase-like PRPP-binding protein